MDALYTEEQWQALLDKQRELEDQCMSDGALRFRKRLMQAQEHEKGFAVGAAKRLLTAGLDPLETRIQQFVDEAKGKRGAKHCALRWINEIGVAPAAYLTLRVVLNNIEMKRSLSGEAREIARLIQDELRYRRLKEEAPALFNYRMARFTTSSYAHMARSLNATIRYAKIDTSDIQISQTHSLLLGAKLIELLIEATSLVRLEGDVVLKPSWNRKKKVRQSLYIEATEDTLKWITERNTALEITQPVTLPMVVPPLQWGAGRKGGYRFALREKWGLLRGVQGQKLSTPTHEMPIVYAAINAIQNTPWRINHAVLDLVESIINGGGEMAGIPSSEPVPMPAKPVDIDTNAEARRAWRRVAHQAKEDEHARHVRVMEFARTLIAARAVKEEPVVFFPHNLDFRGRIYPVSSFLTPQGDDLQKALLTFAQGKAIGSLGARYLAIHGANQLGETPEGEKVSRMTLDERVSWIERHTNEIMQVANSPLRHTWWAKADDPFQFFAFCVEWRNYKTWGDEYVCALPVSQDGSCNGLQHYSAMLRDEVGGKAVNVVPQDQPQDIYQVIADKLLAKLEREAAYGNKHAANCLRSGVVGRKLAKRPTMTFGYGSKPYGFQNQLVEFLMKEHIQEVREYLAQPVEDRKGGLIDISEPCQLIATLIWQSLLETAVAAGRAMDWLQKCARAVVREGKPVEWTVPVTGFRVQQPYRVSTKHQIKTILAGRVIQPAVYVDTPEPERHKQVNGIAPNVVHSLDAAALMMTIAQAANDGLECFAAIHDSYGTVPADMAVLAQATRQCFFRLYASNDVPQMLCDQFAEQVKDPTEIPSPPAYGVLDLSGVLVSDYFFC